VRSGTSLELSRFKVLYIRNPPGKVLDLETEILDALCPGGPPR
jgi:hypothetical protein